jgi:hypothetical protein
MDALIGHTGFVGKTLRHQHDFGAQFNRQTIHEATGRHFGTVVCAAAPGSMFEANNFPQRDLSQVTALIDQLDRINCDRFILISSIAVLNDFSAGYDETTTAFQQMLPYGRNRRELEHFCASRFKHCLIVRLPALFGSGLRKNFFFDLLNPVPSMIKVEIFDRIMEDLPSAATNTLRALFDFDHSLKMYRLNRPVLNSDIVTRVALENFIAEAGYSATQFHHPDTTYQYYDMARLWADIKIADAAGCDVVHLAPEPIRAAVIHQKLTGRPMPRTAARQHNENMHTAFAHLWGRQGHYLDLADSVLERLKIVFDIERADAQNTGSQQ